MMIAGAHMARADIWKLGHTQEFGGKNVYTIK